MSDRTIPEPWLSFLREIDRSLESEVSFHCFGAFAITLLYGLPRETSDVDVISAVVGSHYDELTILAGKNSSLHKKHKVYLDLVGSIATVPDDYKHRLISISPTTFEKVKLKVMEAHDIILSKLNRDWPKDIQDVEHLAKVAEIDTQILRDRYQQELRHNVTGPPERSDQTLELWIEVIDEHRSSR